MIETFHLLPNNSKLNQIDAGSKVIQSSKVNKKLKRKVVSSYVQNWSSKMAPIEKKRSAEADPEASPEGKRLKTDVHFYHF